MYIRNLTLPENEQNKEYHKHEKKFDMKGNIVQELKVNQCDMMEMTDIDCKLVIFTCFVGFFCCKTINLYLCYFFFVTLTIQYLII